MASPGVLDGSCDALEVALHIFGMFCEAVSDDLVLFVRPVFNGSVESATARAERAVLGDNGAIVRRLEPKTPCCGRATTTSNLPFNLLPWFTDSDGAFAAPDTNVRMLIRSSEPCAHGRSRRTIEPFGAFEFVREARRKVDVAHQFPERFRGG